MQMTGEQFIPAPRETVWAALNDPDMLKASIPGCQSLTREGENGFTAKVAAKVGPVSATFTGNVALSDIDPPNGYTLSGSGSGGAAGMAKGGAKVSLLEKDGGTLLRYEVNAQVQGKLAQLGARLIDGAAKMMADEFFTRFSAAVPKPVAEIAAASPPVSAPEMPPAIVTAEPEPLSEAPLPAWDANQSIPASSPQAAKGGLPPLLWVSGLVAVVVLFIVFMLLAG
jgi:carbon monoxide dehydrogenase subunit G